MGRRKWKNMEKKKKILIKLIKKIKRIKLKKNIKSLKKIKIWRRY